MYWYLDAFKRFSDFTGKSSREAFWCFFIPHLIITTLLILMEIQLDTSWLLEGVYSILLFVPSLAITVRRLHDTNRSGWWISIICLPVFGFLILFVLLLQSSNSHDDIESTSFTVN